MMTLEEVEGDSTLVFPQSPHDLIEGARTVQQGLYDCAVAFIQKGDLVLDPGTQRPYAQGSYRRFAYELQRYWRGMPTTY